MTIQQYAEKLVRTFAERGLTFGTAESCTGGLCAATGTLIPPIVQGHAADLVKDAGAVMTLVGVVGSLVGICFVGYAGRLKENELPEEEKVYDRNTSIETLKFIVSNGYEIKKRN